MLITLDEAKSYLLVDGTDEDTEITALIGAAETYLTNAGATLTAGNELAKLAVKMLVVHWHENREPVGQASKIAFGLSSIIAQLQYCYPEVTA